MILINGKPLNITMFPDNTSQVWKVPALEIPHTNWLHIVWQYQNEGEFIHLAQLKTLMDARGFRSCLDIKYLPYARQDKEVSNSATFALRTFANLLNSLGFEEIRIVDPHSLVAVELIKNSTAIYTTDLVSKILDITKTKTVCYPDKGAVEKYTKIYNYAYMYGEKVRDQATGNILKYDLKISGIFDWEKVLIVDDICDGGMTFKLLAKDLLAAGATEVNLFVTHGIFSKGLQTLKDSGINRIFTQDGEVSEENQQITYRRL